MKKAKIMLSAIAAIAIVSGALAFKAKNAKFGNITIWTCNTVDKLCDISITEAARFTVGGADAVTYSSVAIDPTVACPANTCPNTYTVVLENQ